MTDHPNTRASMATWADQDHPTKPEVQALVETLKKDGDLKAAQDLEVLLPTMFPDVVKPPCLR